LVQEKCQKERDCDKIESNNNNKNHNIIIIIIIIIINFTLEEDMKAKRGSRSIFYSFFNLGAGWGGW